MYKRKHDTIISEGNELIKRQQHGKWKNKDNLRIMYYYTLEKIGADEDFNNIYKITKKFTCDIGISGLLASRYSGSFMNFLIDNMPENHQAQFIPWYYPNIGQLAYTNNKTYWDITEHRNAAAKWFSKQIGADIDSDIWYSITIDTFKKNKLYSLLRRDEYHCSPSKFAITHSNVVLIPWYFNQVPNGFWKNKDNHKDALLHMECILGADTDKNNWYKLTQSALESEGLFPLVANYYRGSPQLFLEQNGITIGYPNCDLLPWCFCQVSAGFWEQQKSIDMAIEYILDHFNVYTNEEHLYNINYDWFQEHRLSTILQKHGDSPQRLLHQHLPNIYNKLAPWKFSAVPIGFWDIRSNQRMVYDAIALKLNVKADFNNWYYMTQNTFYEEHLAGLLSMYNMSPYSFIKEFMPRDEFENFHPERLQQAPIKYYKNKENHNEIYKRLRKEYELDKNFDNIYKIEVQDMNPTLVRSRYYGSGIDFWKHFLPEYEWNKLRIWKFSIVPNGFWDDKKNRVDCFVNGICKTLNLKNDSPLWEYVTKDDIIDAGFGNLLSHYPSTKQLLLDLLVTTDEIKEKIRKKKSSIGEQKVYLELMNDPDLHLLGADSIDRTSVFCNAQGVRLYWDFVIRHNSTTIILEVDGSQHFTSTPFFTDYKTRHEKDRLKVTRYRQPLPCTVGHSNPSRMARISYKSLTIDNIKHLFNLIKTTAFEFICVPKDKAMYKDMVPIVTNC